MNPMPINPNSHEFLISFPDWFYAAISFGVLSMIFYLGAIHSKLKKVLVEFPKICRALDLISQKLKEKRFFDEHVYASASSPIKLTEKGQILLKESEADAFVVQHKAELIGKIREKNPKTAYDVQILARDVVESLQETDRFARFKDFVYQKGMPLEPIFIVMGILLRDLALKELNFKVEDIDQHDPNKKNNTKE